MKTRAAVLRGPKEPFVIEELELADPAPGEALVRMVAAGMCHTDLLSREFPPEAFRGPTVFGHEGAGVVEAVGEDVTSVAEGDHVVLSFNSCGACPSCRQVRPAYCYDFALHNMSGGRPDGSASLTDTSGASVGSHYFGQSSFSEMSVVAERSLVKVDQSLDLARLGPLGCGIQTGAGAILNSLGVEGGASVVIAGAGALGLAAVMATRISGAGTVIAIDRHESRLEAAQRYGATHVVSGDPAEITAQILEATGAGADYGFETTGNGAVLRAVLEGLSPVGTLGVAGVGFGDLTLDHLSLFPGRHIHGIFEGDSVPQDFIPHLAQLNADGEFPFHELIQTFPLENINDAEAASASGEAIKPVLTFA